MGTRVKIGDGQHTYSDIPVLVGDVSKGRLDELAEELANEAILYIGNTSGNTTYKGERGEKNSNAKKLEYTPRPIDIENGIIEDVINVNDDKITSNYQYQQVNKKLLPFDLTLEEPVELQTIFEMYVDDELVIEITNAWLAKKDTTDPEFSPTPYTVSESYEYKSLLTSTGERQVQYRYYEITIKDDDGKIRDIVGGNLPTLYYIYDNENVPNENYNSIGEFYFIDNFATIFRGYSIDIIPLYIRTVHFDGIKSTFKFSSTMPKIDTNPEMIEYKTNYVCSKYPIGSTNGEDFGITIGHLKKEPDSHIYTESEIKFENYSDIKNFFSKNVVVVPELTDLVSNYAATLDVRDNENVKIKKTLANTFYIEYPSIHVKAPVYYVNYKNGYCYAIIPNISKIEGNAGVLESYLRADLFNDMFVGNDTYITQTLHKGYFGYYYDTNNMFRSPFTLACNRLIYDSHYNGSPSYGHCFVAKNNTVDSIFSKQCLYKIYHNGVFIGCSLNGSVNRQYDTNNAYFNFNYQIKNGGEETPFADPDYIVINGKQYTASDNGSVFYTNIDYDSLIENIESYTIEVFFKDKLHGTDEYKYIYFDVDYVNKSLDKITYSTYYAWSFLATGTHYENSSKRIKYELSNNIDIKVVETTIPTLISYDYKDSNYIYFKFNEKSYVEDYNIQWNSYGSPDKPKITIYFDVNTYYYRIDKYVNGTLVSNEESIATESNEIPISIPLEIGMTLVSVTPIHKSINSQGQYVFDISEGTSANPVVISLNYTTDNAVDKIWPLQVVEDYTYGWLVNGQNSVESELTVSSGNIRFALSGWNTNAGTSSAYNEQSQTEYQPWFDQYWALKNTAKYYSIGADGEKLAGCPTYFDITATSGNTIQIFYYNANKVEIAKSPKLIIS